MKYNLKANWHGVLYPCCWPFGLESRWLTRRENRIKCFSSVLPAMATHSRAKSPRGFPNHRALLFSLPPARSLRWRVGNSFPGNRGKIHLTSSRKGVVQEIRRKSGRMKLSNEAVNSCDLGHYWPGAADPGLEGCSYRSTSPKAPKGVTSSRHRVSKNRTRLRAVQTGLWRFLSRLENPTRCRIVCSPEASPGNGGRK